LTALVRDETRAEKLETATKSRVRTILGDLDTPSLPQIASQFDIVIHLASSDHPRGATAIVQGLEERAKTSVRKPMIIHTSGAGVIFDHANGKYEGTTIFPDDDLTLYHALPPTAWHKNVDNIVLEAGDRGIIDGIIVCPALVFGVGQGLFGRHSGLTPALASSYLAAGKAYTTGEGLNRFAIIHVIDCSQLFLVVLDAALHGNIPPNPRDRYYFGEADEFVFKDAAQAVANALYARGKIASPEVVMIPTEGNEELVKRLNDTELLNNCRCRAVKARQLGWKPKNGGMKEFLEDAKETVDYILGLSKN
jgi:nucleoside-diphosphate-sugar epimerase